MNIAIDARPANTENLTGVENYTLQLLQQFNQLDKLNDYTFLFSEEVLQKQIPQPSKHLKHKIIRPKKFWPFLRLPIELIANRSYDLFFSPIFAVPLLTPIPSITTFHDLAYELFPNYFTPYERYRQQFLSRITIKKATHIITISESTKKDLINIYNAPPDKITTIHIAYNDKLFKMANTQETARVIKKYKLNFTYILFTGTLQGRKGIHYLFQAFDKLKMDPSYAKLHLVIVGKKGWKDDKIQQTFNSMKYKSDVMFTGYVDSNDLPAIYTNAKLFVFPSIYEGFGIPLLEAMACSTPVLTAKNSSLPEIASDAAIYTTPSNINAFTEDIANILKNKKMREILINKGLENIKRFSWEKTANKTLSVFNKVLQQ